MTMKNFLHVINAKPRPRIKIAKISRYKYDYNKRFFIYKVGDYWWRLTQTQWADHLDIGRSTVSTRLKLGYPLNKVFGFTKVKHGVKNVE